jgi:hypothetical protein
MLLVTGNVLNKLHMCSCQKHKGQNNKKKKDKKKALLKCDQLQTL